MDQRLDSQGHFSDLQKILIVVRCLLKILLIIKYFENIFFANFFNFSFLQRRIIRLRKGSHN